MRLQPYRGKHLKPRPVRHGPTVVATVASLSLTAPPARAGTHMVRAGQTLSGIADRYDTSVAALARANRLSNPNLIIAGTRLRIPSRARVSSVHVVQPGETLTGIAVRYRASVAALVRRNHLKDPNLIVSGTKLKVPAGPNGAPPVSAPSIRHSLVRQARSHGLDPALVKAVAWQESGWRQDVKSSAGAVGVMQVMPGTARFVNRVLGGGRLRLHKAEDNIHLGVMYLRHMLGRFRTRKALAGYYSGPGAVKRRLDKGQRAYVNNVQALTRRFS